MLEQTTVGKALITKLGERLLPRERQVLVQLIVEHQLQILPSVTDTIRQEVWSGWAREICSLFKEHPDIYYVPYRTTERQALPASGLLHNRLITHRRFLKPAISKRSCGNISEKTDIKRNRPLPQKLSSDSEDEEQIYKIKWLESSSSPFEIVLQKWESTNQAREDILKQKTIDEYFQKFPSLNLPNGHLLVSENLTPKSLSHIIVYFTNLEISNPVMY